MGEAVQAASAPWSGYWWPNKRAEGANLYERGGPLDKYDRYVKQTRGHDPGARAYEERHFSSTGSENGTWWGHCHGLAAAAILVPALPADGIDTAGVHFTQDDLEGLATALYSNPKYEWLAGTRSDTDDPANHDFQDMNPAWMDYLLRTRIGQQGTSFVMDEAAGAPVWNYPVAGFDRVVTGRNADGSRNVRTAVSYTDAIKGAATAQTFTKTYTYTLTDRPDGTTDGAWTGDSVLDHPDFAWMPTGRGEPPNVKLDPAIVSEILDAAA